jgi:hypothetical protein
VDIEIFFKMVAGDCSVNTVGNIFHPGASGNENLPDMWWSDYRQAPPFLLRRMSASSKARHENQRDKKNLSELRGGICGLKICEKIVLL